MFHFESRGSQNCNCSSTTFPHPTIDPTAHARSVSPSDIKYESSPSSFLFFLLTSPLSTFTMSFPNARYNALPNFLQLVANLNIPEKTSLFVILDVNGLLMERAKNKDADKIRAARGQRNPWRRYKSGHQVWLRPHLKFFLQNVMNRHSVGMWTSGKRTNMEPLLKEVSDFLQLSKPIPDELSFTWCREKCDPDPTNGSYASVKNLNKVWLASLAPRDRTLILDDTFTKVRFEPNSALIVPPYCAEVMGDVYNYDDTLIWAVLYLEYIAERLRQSLNIAAARSGALSFYDFVQVGWSHAMYSGIPPKSVKKAKSLALAFVQSLEDTLRNGTQTQQIQAHAEQTYANQYMRYQQAYSNYSQAAQSVTADGASSTPPFAYSGQVQNDHPNS